MPNYNHIAIVGHVGRDPEVKTIHTGQTVAKFAMATSEHWKNKAGEAQEKTVWIDVECWQKLAEIVQQYVKKGSAILVDGKLDCDNWEADDGSKRSKHKIKANTIQLLSRKGEESAHAPAEPQQEKPENTTPDDLPF